MTNSSVHHGLKQAVPAHAVLTRLLNLTQKPEGLDINKSDRQSAEVQHMHAQADGCETKGVKDKSS